MKFRVFPYCNTNQRNSFLTFLKWLIINSTQDRLESVLFLIRYVWGGITLQVLLVFLQLQNALQIKILDTYKKQRQYIFVLNYLLQCTYLIGKCPWKERSKGKNYELDFRDHANKKTTKGNISIFAVLEEKKNHQTRVLYLVKLDFKCWRIIFPPQENKIWRN